MILALASCETTTPLQKVHVNAPPDVAQMLRHPAIVIKDARQGTWVTDDQRGAPKGWRAHRNMMFESYDGYLPNLVCDSFFSALGVVSLIVEGADRATAPSKTARDTAKVTATKAIASMNWQDFFYQGFKSEASHHGASVAGHHAGQGDCFIEVVVREAAIGKGNPRPSFLIEWGICRPGAKVAAWRGRFEVEAEEKKNVVEWTNNNGEPLIRALRDLFVDAGKKLGKALYEGEDVDV